MQIDGYRIILKRLSIDDIELVRYWRNSDLINQFMEHREYINSVDQIEWFESIDNTTNNFFVIYIEDKKIGLIYGADIDWELQQTGNAGIFIWATSYWETSIPLRASILLTDTSLLLGLKKTYIKILRSNGPAIHYNTQLGYSLLPDQEDIVNQNYVLTAPAYRKARMDLQKMLPEIDLSSEIKIFLKKDNAIDSFYINKISSSSDLSEMGYKIIIN
ncbi:MAG: hypothetical protein WBA16_08975 [Nonlabens sp.]